MTCARRCLYGPISAPSVRAAWKGHLCETCYRRLKDHLAIAGPLAGLLRDAVVPSLQSVKFGEERVQSSREAKIPFREVPSLLVDELAAVILGWAGEAYRLLGPRRVPGGVVWPSEQIERLASLDGATARLATTEVADTTETVSDAASFLLERLDDVAALPGIAALHDEVVDVVRRALTTTGQSRLRLEDSIGAECPICLTRKVWVTWGDTEEPDVICKQCGLVLHAGKEPS